VTILTGKHLKSIDITVPEIFVGGLLGSVTVMVFSGWAIAAVGNAAEDVIEEVRRQFRENPGILTYEQKPDYKK
jgi:Na+/H+-translocating membrane pyrophosphatase